MILIIGYGNPLRCDDAIGQQIAQEMKACLKRNDVEVLLTFQLTPELVENVSCSELVVFIDARIDGTPGEVTQETIKPQAVSGAFTHNVSPRSLLATAYELYGALPKGIMISISGADFSYGCELSPELHEKLPSIADQVKAIIESSARVQVYEEKQDV